MKMYSFKTFLTAMILACLIPVLNAQFDDVYYDPDNVDLGTGYASSYDDESESITYYDDDEYEYYDDYDYYYSSRIRRFYRPSPAFGFYDPYYVNYSYYDPYYTDAYYYPGASIYVNFGNDDYWSYRNWRRWNRYNRWNSYNSWNNWGPAQYYYSYNSWCAPSYNYWGGYNSYNSYSNYYNNYYNGCPSPVSNYYGINNSTVNTINNGGTRGTYYGPRITGNSGSSPRGPGVKPGNVQPVMKGLNDGVTENNDKQKGIGDGGTPRIVTPTKPSEIQPGADQSPSGIPSTREAISKDVVREIPVDKEIKRDPTTTPSGRPVFRPYPTNERPAADTQKPSDNRPSYSPSERRNDNAPVRDEPKPQYQPTPRNYDDRPSYSPPARSDDKPSYTPRSNDRPSYSPPARENSRNEDRPSRQPSQRSNDSERNDDRPSPPPSRGNDSNRSDDRPSYSPPSRNESSGNGGSSPSPSRDNSSGSSGGSSNSSPRSPGRG